MFLYSLGLFYFFYEFIVLSCIFYLNFFNFTGFLKGSLSFSKLVLNIFFLYFMTLFNDKDSVFFVREVVFNWLCFLIIFVLFSLIIFINEEVSTSVFEVFFDSFFISWLIFFIPDFFIFGCKAFNNKFILAGPWVTFLFLPLIEFFSGVFKSLILSLRINTNLISGHLILSFILIMLEFFIFLKGFNILLFLKFLLSYIFLLEVFLINLQFYIILLLSFLYIRDSSY